MWLQGTVALILLCCVSSHPDEILDLPGLDQKINFRQYSGYLNASNGKHLHYWFVESQRSPSKDPVLLWLNGGPGCSSLSGLLTELGPFHVKTDGKSLYMNPFSWNKIANIIFLESPTGVGFSYSEDGKDKSDDDTTSLDNYLALQHFFDKFPSFRKNDFYISGESYAGIYIPTLAVRILRGSVNINFKGFAIGNGVLDKNKLTNSLMFFAYYHGLIDQSTWDTVVKHCCNGIATRYSCEFSKNVSAECKSGVRSIMYTVHLSGLNAYNLYEECTTSEWTRLVSNLIAIIKSLPFYEELPFYDKILRLTLPCTDSSNVTFYLNQKNVREALHIPSHLKHWKSCSIPIVLLHKRIYDTMRPQILELIGSRKLRGLIYNGDVDMVCNFLGDEWFCEDLGLQELSKYKPWKYDNQVAGFFKSYTNLTFATIKGSGHMVPEDKPGPAFQMISNFLSNKPFEE